MIYAYLMLLAALLLPVGDASAGPPVSAENLLRIKFLTAERRLARGDRAGFLRLSESLADYPLLPYLRAADFLRGIDARQQPDFEAALGAVHGGPLAGRLRRAWLRSLGRRNRWGDFLANLPPESGSSPARSSRLRCLELRALLATAQSERANRLGRALWLVGRSQPSACNAPFLRLEHDGVIDDELKRRRAWLAMGARDAGMVRHLVRRLAPRDRAVPEAWLDVRRRPERVHRYREARFTPVVEEGLRRMAHDSPERAISLWRKLRGSPALTAPAAARAARHIGMALTRRGEYAAANRWLDGEDAEPRHRAALVFNAIALGAWAQALAGIDRLGKDARDERWRYWRARALEASGQALPAHAIWAELAKQRSFYGYLSADRLGVPYTLGDEPFVLSDEARERIESSEGFRRARELRALGRRAHMRREWHYLAGDRPEGQIEAARVAHAWGWHGCAITSLARSRYLDDLAVRFPTPFESEIRAQATARGLNPAWLYAMTRQESAFMTDARSPKGALGLMQLMPRTARSVAARSSLAYRGTRELLNPEKNLALGSRYLREMLDRFSHPALASAAYNAGPHRVRRWLPDASMPADLWIELIPYPETRTYVKRVLTYMVVYEHRLGVSPTRLRQVLTPVGPSA